MNINNLTLIFYNLEKEHLGKDVFLVPYYLGKKLKCKTTIVYQNKLTNRFFKDKFRNINLIPLKNIFLLKGLEKISFFISSLFYVIFKGKKIDLLMTFHFRTTSAILCMLYKLVNPNGKFYLKVDGGKDIIDVRKNASFIKNRIYNILLKQSDYISLETDLAYQLWKKNLNIPEKIFFIENGFDEEELSKLSLKIRSFKEKENIFITVGRLGAFEKNSQMFLNAIDKLSNVNNWLFYFIGPYDDDFKKEIKQFFAINTHLKEKVIFTGPIYDKSVLWEYYNRAKVFVLTSRSEGYPIVFSEAYRFQNYIITTRIGGAEDILLKNNNFGKIIDQDNSEQLKSVIEKIISDNNYFIQYHNSNYTDNSWNKHLSSLTKNIRLS